MKHFLIGFLFAVLAGTAAAAPPQYGLIVPIGSKHYGGDGLPCNWEQTRIRQHRERNPGLGVQMVFDRVWAVEVGYYENSAWNESVYTLTKWTPLDYNWVRLGLGVGVATGYCTKPVLPMAGFVSSFDITKQVGIDVLATPPIDYNDGVIGVQIRLTFW